MERAELHNLMGLAGHGVEGWELGGSITGILGSSVFIYSQLAKRGMTKFFGTSKKHKVKWFAAQGAAEAGIDISYNHDGYTMMMGLLTGEDQNRALSVLDAMILGTTFNLAGDSWRVLTNLNPRQANIALQRMADDITAEHLKNLGVIAYSKHLGETPPPASASVKQPAVVTKDGRPHAGATSNELVEAEKRVWMQEHEIDEVIELLQEELKKDGHNPNKIRLMRVKIRELERRKGLQSKDASLLTGEEDAIAKQLALEEMDNVTKGGTESAEQRFKELGYEGSDDVLRRVDDIEKDALPEGSLITPGLLEEAAGNMPQEVSRSTLRAAFKKFMQSGELADSDWAELGIYLGFGSAVGGAFSAVTDDERRLAGFMMGFGLPLAAYHKMKALSGVAARGIANKYLNYVPKTWASKFVSWTTVPVRSQIERISPFVSAAADQSEMLAHIRTVRYMERMHGFFGQMNELVRSKVITKQEKEQLYALLRDGKVTSVPKTQSSGKEIRERWLREGEVVGDPAGMEELTAVRLMDEFDARRGDESVRGVTRTYFEDYEAVLREVGDLLDNHNLINGKIKNYFPRSLKDGAHKKLLKIKGITEDPVIVKLWEKERIRQSVTELSQYDKAVIADMYIRSHPDKFRPGFAKKRQYKEVPEELEHLYDDFETSNLRYITQMMDYAHNAEFLGVGLTKSSVRNVIDDVAMDQHVAEVTKQAKREAQGKVTLGKMKPEEVKAYVDSRIAEAEKTLIRKPKSEGKTEGAYDYMETIGHKVAEWVEKGHVPADKADRLKVLLHNRYARPNGMPMITALRWGRDVSYSFSIGNIYSAMTQVTDTAITGALGSRGSRYFWTSPVRGWMDDTVFTTAAQRLVGKKHMKFNLEDFGFDDMKLRSFMAEFEDEAATTKWLRLNLKAVGFRYADVFGKEVNINATYKELRRAAMSKKDSVFYKRLEGEYAPAYGKDFDRFVKALQKGDKYDDNVMGAIYSRLLDQYPMTKSSMPMVYAKHPNARVLYQLSSFTIKQIDLLRKRSLDQMAKGIARNDAIGNQMIKDSFRDTLKYAVLFGGSTMGVSSMKDFMLGREVDMSEYKVNAALNLMGLHRVHVERVRRLAKGDWKGMNAWERTVHALGKTLTPPMIQMGMDIASDVGKSMHVVNPRTGEREIPRESAYGRQLKLLGLPTGWTDSDVIHSEAASWRYLPVIGRDLFWRLGLGKTWEEQRLGEKRLKTPPARKRIPKIKIGKEMPSAN